VSGTIKRQKGHFVRVERTIVAMVFGTDNMSFVGTLDHTFLIIVYLPLMESFHMLLGLFHTRNHLLHQ
jgi:hypothetical protein